MRTRFLDCVLDTEARSLRRHDVDVHLTAKAFEVLALLVSERPRAVTKTELLEAVWPGTFVTDASLARTIHEIRSAIGDEKTAGAIRTVHGYGYAFVTDARDEAPPNRIGANTPAHVPAVAWLLSGSRVIPLVEGSHLAGRDPNAAVHVESAQASWHHARLVVTSDSVTIADLSSKNGTQVNSGWITAPTRLSDGDEVHMGTVRFVLRTGPKPVETETRDAGQ